MPICNFLACFRGFSLSLTVFSKVSEAVLILQTDAAPFCSSPRMTVEHTSQLVYNQLRYSSSISFDMSAAIEILINTLILTLSQPTLFIFPTFFGVPFAWLKLPHHH